MTKDRMSGIIVTIFGVIIFLLSTQIKGSIYSTVIGPELFPKMASLGLILCGIGLIIRKAKEEGKPFCNCSALKKLS